MKRRFRVVALGLILSMMVGLLPSGSVWAETNEEDVEDLDITRYLTTDTEIEFTIGAETYTLDELWEQGIRVTQESFVNITLRWDTISGIQKGQKLFVKIPEILPNIVPMTPSFSDPETHRTAGTVSPSYELHGVVFEFDSAYFDYWTTQHNSDTLEISGLSLDVRSGIDPLFLGGDPETLEGVLTLKEETDEEPQEAVAFVIPFSYITGDMGIVFDDGLEEADTPDTPEDILDDPAGPEDTVSYTQYLQITNNVIGQTADQEESFTYRITLQNEEGQSYLFSNGLEYEEFSLNDQGTMSYTTALPEGYSYTVEELLTEEQQAKYATSYTATDGSAGDGTMVSASNVVIEDDGINTITFTNTRIVKDLILKQTVSGASGYSTTQPFTYRLYLTDAEGAALSSRYAYQILRADGTTEEGLTLTEADYTEVELCHGDTLTIQDLPDGFQYRIVQEAVEKYVPIITVDGKRAGADGEVSAATAAGAVENIEVTYQNVYGYTLTLTKETVGDHAWSAFSFYIYLRTKNNGRLTGTYPVISQAAGTATAPTLTSLTFSSASQIYLYGLDEYAYCGYTSVTLRKDQSITICGLPDDYQYYIQEQKVTNSTGYYSSALFYVSRIDGPEEMDADLIYESAWQKSIEENVSVTFEGAYDPYSLQIGTRVAKADEVDKAVEFTYKIYLFRYDSDTSTYTAITGDKSVTTMNLNYVDELEIPNNTLTFVETEEIPSALAGTGTVGLATVTMKHGQAISINNLGENFGYYVEEVMNPHYFVSKFIHGVAGANVTSLTDDAVSDWFAGTCYNKVVPMRGMLSFYNVYQNLTVTKKVEGSDTDQDFSFTIYLARVLSKSATAVSPVVGDFEFVITDSTTGEQTTETVHFSQDAKSTRWGSYTFTLKKGQTALLKKIPTACYFRVSEAATKHFTTTMSLNGATATEVQQVSGSSITADQKVVVTNTYVPPTTKDLTITKTVDGNMSDSSKSFTFTVTLTNAEGEALTGTFSTSSGDRELSDGKLSVSLKDGESFTIYEVPIGSLYTISESGAEQYTTTIRVDEVRMNPADEKTVSGTIQGEDDVITVAYTNTFDIVVPTGLHFELLPYMVFVVFGLGLALMLLHMHRRSRRHK